MVARVLQFCPNLLIIWGSRIISLLLCHGLRFRYTIIHHHLCESFNYSGNEPTLKTLIRNIYHHFGLLIVELLCMPRYPRKELLDRIIWHDESNLSAALKKGRGVIILSAHLGNWELCGIALAAKGYKINAVGKATKSALGNTMLRLIRDDNGVHTIPKSSSMKEICARLEKNEIIVFMLDQNMTYKEGVFVDFFGRLAATSPGLALVAARSGAVIIPGYNYRDKDLWHHHCVFLPEFHLENPHHQKRANHVHNTALMTHILEQIIKDHPEQWLWMHKRWRTRPRSNVSERVNDRLKS